MARIIVFPKAKHLAPPSTKATHGIAYKLGSVAAYFFIAWLMAACFYGMYWLVNRL